MKILFLTTAHNSLSQRLLIELSDHGHAVSVTLAASAQAMIRAVEETAPELIVAPMLKATVPEEIWSKHVCLIVHPGIKGDRGPSSLDWAISDGEKSWGVTVLQAAAEMDAGDIWASHEFPLDGTPSKSSLYRDLVTEAAVRGVLEAVEKFEAKQFSPEPLDYGKSDVRGRLRPPMRQADRAINWTRDKTDMIVRKVRAADSAPGVLASLLGRSCFLFGAHHEDRLAGPPGQILARRDGAVCIGTIDGAVWISHLKLGGNPGASREACQLAGAGCELCAEENCAIAGIKLPAAQALGALLRVREAPLPIDAPLDHRTFREIVYTEEDAVGCLSFDFYNGAMSTDQCRRLRDAFLYARSRSTKVIALLGGRDFFSNGIHLNVIEAAPDPAAESWRNINAIDDLIIEILNTMSHLVVAGMRGNAGAGGAMMALAADHVFAREGVVINPHYKGMGGLYGSEYWTYTLPRRAGAERAEALTNGCGPMGAKEAKAIGFIDDCFGANAEAFETALVERALEIARRENFWAMLRAKHAERVAHERVKPLAAYRAEELEQMRVNFFGPNPAYHLAREKFVHKGAKPVISPRPAQQQDDDAHRKTGLLANWPGILRGRANSVANFVGMGRFWPS